LFPFLEEIQPVVEKDLLSQMIYHGKQLYLKDLLCQTIPMRKMGYSPKQIAWCQENESYMWRYFIEKKCCTATIRS
jgi:hypothetical protein